MKHNSDSLKRMNSLSSQWKETGIQETFQPKTGNSGQMNHPLKHLFISFTMNEHPAYAE